MPDAQPIGDAVKVAGDGAPIADMIRIPGGDFLMGSDRHYPEEAPAHRARVDGFWIDRTPVTNREFRRFVEATGYVIAICRPPGVNSSGRARFLTRTSRPMVTCAHRRSPRSRRTDTASTT
jgi:formylglycine-generating enzyme required for sulfatase activity